MKTKELPAKKKRLAYKTIPSTSFPTVARRIFRHGGSYAVHIPIAFAKRVGCQDILIEETPNGLFIHPAVKMDKMENDPLFGNFIQAIYSEALANPKKLHEIKELWDDKTITMLKDVKPFDE